MLLNSVYTYNHNKCIKRCWKTYVFFNIIVVSCSLFFWVGASFVKGSLRQWTVELALPALISGDALKITFLTF